MELANGLNVIFSLSFKKDDAAGRSLMGSSANAGNLILEGAGSLSLVGLTTDGDTEL